MATSKTQRIGILVIAVVMIIGTIFSFFAIILQNSNAQIDAERSVAQQAELEEEYEKYNELAMAYQEEVSAENARIEEEYGPILREYEGAEASFDADEVTELEINDLREGTGEAIDSIETARAYYIGWNKDGNVFDSSIVDEDTLSSPISIAGTIEGLQQGVVGMKVGGVRELTIPSEMAYGDQEVSDDIPANSVLRFIVVAVPATEIEEPEMSARLQELLGGMGMGMGM